MPKISLLQGNNSAVVCMFSICSLSYEMFIASSNMSSPESEIMYFLFHVKVHSRLLEVIQELLMSSCLLVISIFPLLTCFRSQFLRKMWPINLVFIVRRMILSYLTLCNTLFKLSVQMKFSIPLQHHILLINHLLLYTEVIVCNWSRMNVEIKLVNVWNFLIISHMQQTNCTSFLATSFGCKILSSLHIIKMYGRKRNSKSFNSVGYRIPVFTFLCSCRKWLVLRGEIFARKTFTSNFLYVILNE